jgi:ribosomal protein S6--L-glutamate ligase
VRIAVLSGGDGWHVRDLHRAAAARGHDSVTVDFRRLAAGVADGPPPLGDFDAVVVRTMPPGTLEQVVFRMDLLHRARAAGVAVLNPPAALEACVDKYLATARLAAAGLAVPPTAVCQHADAALEAFARLGGDVVVKPLFGAEGRGMLRVADPELAWRTFRTLERTGCVLYLQQFIRHPGHDVRIFVLDGRVLAAMRRHGRGDWRTNVAQGGLAEAFDPPAELVELALRAADAVGTVAAGVDLLPGPGGEWYALEVNAVPGWRALAPACGVDVADALVRRLEAGSAPTSVLPAGAGLPPGPAATLACLWEATACKPGNVHPRAAFPGLRYADFVASASAIGPAFADAAGQPVGRTVLAAIAATRRAVATNTNLGMVLLLAPLAATPDGLPLAAGVRTVLAGLTLADSREVFAAIRLAQPGGMGHADAEDVADEPTLPLREVMALAAGRDSVARQYAEGYPDVFSVGVPALRRWLDGGWPLETAIVGCHLALMAAVPDSLIARKRGPAVAAESAARAAAVLAAGWPSSAEGRRAADDLDAWLRADGHARNPGTTADLVAACLFVGLREGWLAPATPMAGG